MSAIYDYGQRQKDEEIKDGIKEGKTNEKIKKETELTLEDIEKIRNEN